MDLGERSNYDYSTQARARGAYDALSKHDDPTVGYAANDLDRARRTAEKDISALSSFVRTLGVDPERVLQCEDWRFRWSGFSRSGRPTERLRKVFQESAVNFGATSSGNSSASSHS